MAKVQNTFLKSKMNKDLDARLLPEGEYRDARNVQVSKSEGSKVGNLENTLGNIDIVDYSALTGFLNIVCIGSFSDELNSTIYLFFTDYTDENPNLNLGQGEYEPAAKNFIISTDTSTNQSTVLVQGAFLNFSQTNLITGVNVLEDLLFFTDNRNQPRVINTTLANTNPANTNPTYYTTEDQISVAKYNPFQAMELFEKSGANGITTMKDVSSLFLPNGGSATCIIASPSGVPNEIYVNNVVGEINIQTVNPYGKASRVFVQNNIPGGDFTLTDTGETVDTVVGGGAGLTITLTGNVTLAVGQTVVFNANPYFDPTFAGDPDYLEDKFVRFAYRYKFQDNTYSIFSPFTQIAFIPRQDGYFMFVDSNNVTQTGSQDKNDQDETYRSTIVYFMENKVNSIDLKIPLPFNNYDLQNALKIKEIDILYKESDGIAVRVVETLSIDKIINQSCICEVDGAQTPGAAGNPIAIKNIKGGITIGTAAFGPGISGSVTSFTPTDPSNPVSGNITVSSTVAQLDNNSPIIIGDIENFTYEYRSTKPTKTLPESNLIRVYDKIPVRAQAQEVAGNRVIYGNFQNKINPPDFLNYNVASTEKANFNTRDAAFSYTAGAATYAAGDPINVVIVKVDGSGLWTGYYVTCNDYGVNIPVDTQVTSATSNQLGASTITLSNPVTFPAGVVTVIAEPGDATEDSVTKVEYPNSSVKTNRNYQIGFVLSDRYGRQSSVILSNNETSIIVNGVEYAGSTLFSPYIDPSVSQTSWPGNSLKVLMNEPIPNNNLYNGDITSVDYNPLGWYSYKIVVKQTEQDYYNVYLPGIMASYPNDTTLEIGQTSHTVLINDNINKVPRDLTEVGPDQKQFRSSVQLIGRVQNTTTLISSTNSGASNTQYYPQRTTDTVSVISTVNDLFDFDPLNPPLQNLFPQFYSLESNPLVARLSTEIQIGQLASNNYLPAGGESVLMGAPAVTIPVTSVSGDSSLFAAPNGLLNYLVSGIGIPPETYVSANTTIGGGGALAGEINVTLKDAAGVAVTVKLPDNIKIFFTPTEGSSSVPPFELTRPGLQYLAIAETEPVESAIDIFWETSTSGLISDLNQAVLNNQSNPSGSNISWNPSFDEGLKAPNLAAGDTGYILAAPFQVVDNFGQTILLQPTDALTLEAPGGLPAITNGLGESVSSGARDYFRLIDLGTNASGVGPWQIKITSNTGGGGEGEDVAANINYFDNIYYFYNDNENLRQFTFNFKVVVDGQQNFVTRAANLRNVIPEFFTVEALNQSPLTSITYGPGAIPAIPYPNPYVPVTTSKGIRDLAIININNGAANITEPNPSDGGGALSRRDLEMVNGPNVEINVSIWRQSFGSILGPDAVYQGNTEQPLFSIQPFSFQGGNLKYLLINNSSNFPSRFRGGNYYVQLAIRDGGENLEFITIEIQMIVQLKSANFWNRLQQVDAYGNLAENYNGSPPQYISQGTSPAIFDGFSGCGEASFCQPDSTRTQWWYYPSTLFEITSSDIGASSDNYGWYIYAMGYFDNSNETAVECCTPGTGNSHGIAGSFSMLDYAAALGNPNSITIPMTIPITGGDHLVQRQPIATTDIYAPWSPFATAEIDGWGLPPKINGRIAVTGYDPAEYLWTYEIIQGDKNTALPIGSQGAPGLALTGCMKLFRDVGGSYDFSTGNTTYGFGWNYNDYIDAGITQDQMTQRVLKGHPAIRTPRIKYTEINSSGQKQFYYKPTSSTPYTTDSPDFGGVAQLDPNWNFNGGATPQIIYTYSGPQKATTSPWFYSRTNGTTTDIYEIQKVWAMYIFSGWAGSKWRSGNFGEQISGASDAYRKYWRQWAQTWEDDALDSNGNPIPEDNGAVVYGQAELINNHQQTLCASLGAHLATPNKPSGIENFEFSII